MRLPFARAPASKSVYEQRSDGRVPAGPGAQPAHLLDPVGGLGQLRVDAAGEGQRVPGSACATACRSIRGELAATVIGGRGRCTGPGAIRASATA